MHGTTIRKHSKGSSQIDSGGNTRNYSKWAQITDLMRLEIIYNHGGYYFDTTFECVKPLFDLFNIPKKRFVGCNETTYSLEDIPYLSNAFFGASKKNIILKRLLSKKKLKQMDVYSIQVNRITGPYYLRSGIREKDNFHIFPTHYFYPFVEFVTQGRKVSKNKCHFHKRNKITQKRKQRKKRKQKLKKTKKTKLHHLKNKKGYLYNPCIQYPNSYAIKHWTLGKSWI